MPTSGAAMPGELLPARRQVERLEVGVRREQSPRAAASSKTGMRRVTSRISPAGRPCTLATSRSAPRRRKQLWLATIAAWGWG